MSAPAQGPFGVTLKSTGTLPKDIVAALNSNNTSTSSNNNKPSSPNPSPNPNTSSSSTIIPTETKNSSPSLSPSPVLNNRSSNNTPSKAGNNSSSATSSPLLSSNPSSTNITPTFVTNSNTSSPGPQQSQPQLSASGIPLSIMNGTSAGSSTGLGGGGLGGLGGIAAAGGRKYAGANRKKEKHQQAQQIKENEKQNIKDDHGANPLVKNKQPVPSSEDEVGRRLGEYQLMESIGRGGFGIVYRGLNVASGKTVAIKRVALIGIPKEDLESIEGEIALLQNLSHANIIRYLDSIRTADHLNIILEYAENGALSSLLSKMGGKFPESLTAHYIKQVLHGLHYLHTQGVIHRDIKGANILTTKDGIVKLADFGVATKLNESMKSESVVGTPYWMAPEIIEMTGQQSSACDIWSVGCTVLELLTGKPPYFDLQQMPALFRIVQDEHPPLPDGISRALEDFLLQCFQKDPNRRIDAVGLLKHQWLKNMMQNDDLDEPIVVSVPGTKSKSGSGASVSNPHDDESKEGVFDSDQEEDWDIAIAREQEKDNKQIKSGKSHMKAHATIKPPPPMANSSSKSNNNNNSSVVSASTMNNLSNAAVSKFTSSNSSNNNDNKSGLSNKGPSVGSLKVKLTLDDDEDAFAGFDDDDDDSLPIPTNIPSTSNNQIKAPTGTVTKFTSKPKKLDDFVEREDDENYDLDVEIPSDLNDADPKLKLGGMPTASATSTLIMGSAANRTLSGGASTAVEIEADDGFTDDPFDDIEFEDDRVDEKLQLSKQFVRIINQLSPKNDERQVLDACDKLNEMGMKNPDVVRAMMTQHGVIPIMEMFEVQNPNILHAVLKVVNNLVGKNSKFQQSLATVGLIPAVIRFGGRMFPLDIRVQAAEFVRQLCYASDFTRKMFIACDGLPVLLSFLEENYEHNKTLMWNAIDCIRHVFEITTNPKNDICRLFCKFGLLEPLTRTLEQVNDDKDSPEAGGYVKKIGDLLLLFSQGDIVVKTHFAKQAVIENMLRVLPSLPTETLLLVLKSIRSISMESTTLDLLEQAGAIPALVPFLNSPSTENQHQVLLTMYYLCQIKTSRQEEAALSGIIPHLQRFVRGDHPLKQFAFPILFLLAKSSSRSRLELKKYTGLQFYVDSLHDLYWRSHALEVLAVWLTEDMTRCNLVLNTSTNINKLLTCFRTTTNMVQFEKMLPQFKKLLSHSIRINQSFGRSDVFVEEIKLRLIKHKDSNSIRIGLLKILLLIVVARYDFKTLMDAHSMLPTLRSLCSDKTSVIVASLAQKLLDMYDNPAQTSISL